MPRQWTQGLALLKMSCKYEGVVEPPTSALTNGSQIAEEGFLSDELL